MRTRVHNYTKQTVLMATGALFLLALDQMAKVWARAHMEVTLCNDGVALSMPLPTVLTIVVSVVILSALGVWFVRHEGHAFVERIGLVLLIAGGAGNLIDRVTVGCVTDFINFFELWHFNVADVLIAAGAAAVLWHMTMVAPRTHQE